MRYCYLTKIYEDSNGDSKLYECVLCDVTFSNIAIYRVDLEELKGLANDDKLVKNFEIKDGYLKCENATRQMLNNLIESSKGKEIRKRETKLYSFYYFVRNGISAGYYFVHPDYALDGNVLDGIGFSHFKNLKISESTMSVYCNVLTEDGLKHLSFIFLQDKKLVLNSLFVAVPEGSSLVPAGKIAKAEPIGSITLNHADFQLYKVSGLSIYNPGMIITHSLINKASVEYAKSKNVYNLLSDYSETFSKQKSTGIRWAGKNNSHESPYFVGYTAMMTMPTKAERVQILQKVLDLVSGDEDGIEAIKAWHCEPMKKVMAANLFILICGVTIDAALAKVWKRMDQCQMIMLYSSLYLYSVRATAFMTNTRFANPANPYIVGSEEKVPTLAKERLLDECFN